MKLVFAGTPAFAVPSLKALLGAGHEITAVYTQPDRPAGRGRQLTASPVKQFAAASGLTVLQPPTLAGADDSIASLRPEAMIVVAYGLIVPRTILSVPQRGCINVHASLLPRWRGAAPIARAIEAGDTQTGVCIMQMDAGLDTGAIYACRETAIGKTEMAAVLEPRLAELGATLLVETLGRIGAHDLKPVAQAATGATYARKLRKDEAQVDWKRPATELHCKIRALNPWPVAQTRWQGRALRLWEVAPITAMHGQHEIPGTVLAAGNDGLTVQTGDGCVTITRLQVEGGRPLPAQEFLNGCRISAGDRLGDAGASP